MFVLNRAVYSNLNRPFNFIDPPNHYLRQQLCDSPPISPHVKSLRTWKNRFIKHYFDNVPN